MNHRLTTAALFAAALVTAGCSSNSSNDNDDLIVVDGEEMELSEGKMAVDMQMGKPSDFTDAEAGAVVYETPGYAEVKSTEGNRLLVVIPEDQDLAAVADSGKISGEDFKIMGSKSPIPGITVLGDNALKDAFYARWGLQK